MNNPFVYGPDEPPAILLKPQHLYRAGMSGLTLYDITRGVWKVNLRRVSRAQLAFSVADGKVVGVFDIEGWHLANTTPYVSGRQDQSDPKYSGRFEFTGKPSSMSQKYLGQVVVFGPGRQELRYLNCSLH